MRFPIVSHPCCELTEAERSLAERTASDLTKRDPELRLDSLFQDVATTRLESAPSIHLDDLSEIRRVGEHEKVYFQERARMRAAHGDWIATSGAITSGYEDYCEQFLGLGRAEWIYPASGNDPNQHFPESLWKDRATRRDLVHAIRKRGVRFLHPHMGTRAVWELALLLQQTSHRKVQVIAPPPGVSAFANDKGKFTKLVQQLFGAEATAPSRVVWNSSSASKKISELGDDAVCIALKLPNAAGGAGNMLIPINELRGLSLKERNNVLNEKLASLNYEDGDELLVTLWNREVRDAPSAQLWIPPILQGMPILEGLFSQRIEGQRFTGFMPAQVPDRLRETMARRSLVLARTLQWLGYVGRCSFDMILVGPDIESSEVQFIECNGRWGGTSLPMTLMNQIFGDWKTQPFSSRLVTVQDREVVTLALVIATLGNGLFQRARKAGRMILLNPQRIGDCGELQLLLLKNRWEQSDAPFLEQVSEKLNHLAIHSCVQR